MASRVEDVPEKAMAREPAISEIVDKHEAIQGEHEGRLQRLERAMRKVLRDFDDLPVPTAPTYKDF